MLMCIFNQQILLKIINILRKVEIQINRYINYQHSKTLIICIKILIIFNIFILIDMLLFGKKY